MPRSGVNGTYTLPGAQNTQQPVTTIPSAVNNQGWSDVEQTFNTPQPIAYGGTGVATAAAARTALFGVSTTTDNAVARYDGTAGQLQDSAVVVSDLGDITSTSTDAGAASGPNFIMNRASASPAVSDQIGSIVWRGKDSSAADQDYATIVTEITDPTAGTEDARIFLRAVVNGTMTTLVTVATGTSNVLGSWAASDSLSAATYSASGASAGVAVVGNSGGAASVRTSTTSTALQAHMQFSNPNGSIGSITTTGTTTAYNTTSDENLKNNFRDFDSGTIIDRIPVYLYDWNAGGEGYGAKAQQVYKVFPTAVAPGNGLSPHEDGFIPWSMDWSKLGPVMWREIQDLRLRLASAGL